MTSPQRARLMADIAPLVEREEKPISLSGLETWFQPPGAEGSPQVADGPRHLARHVSDRPPLGHRAQTRAAAARHRSPGDGDRRASGQFVDVSVAADPDPGSATLVLRCMTGHICSLPP